ncbi:Gfpt1 protein [Salpingoeca rosetta]|uniref:glutamine--fructose-6-phosphate transaminase (isomerizing) n=1 Tax=Salpingoeca rosetta (strain ATCC 50818 / BSB-021) TaxID=946362 RepID=F2U7M1_SALR5|nr:Gfpt1 protein [Salpingoeca rosetta]EGD83438.1 Gfpt1 protein [Salpingoeca rosetta]|eukprot:XP_004994942.1 Gfpt1 protein [Salpingoeca rosetta]
MCGIFAYLNHNVERDRKFIVDTLIKGLKRLEYRGYDSAGIAIDGDDKQAEDVNNITIIRSRGKVQTLEDKAHQAMVATRLGSPLLVGIRTDDAADAPDAIPILLSDPKKSKEPVTSDRFMRRTKSWEHLDTHEPVEYFLASDASAVVEHTRRVIFLEDNDVVNISGGHLSLHHLKTAGTNPSNMARSRNVQTLDMKIQQIMKGAFSHFMQKEIFEQPESVVNTMRGRVRFEDKMVKLGGLVDHIGDIKRCRRLLFVACGTSYNSAIATRQFIEEMTELPVIVDIASDFLDRRCPIFRDDVCFFISQSGETADTLKALRYCKSKGALTVGITNTVGSSISRETSCGVHINAGPEIGVASTKAYTSQILTLLMFGLMMAEDSKQKESRRLAVLKDLSRLPELIQKTLDLSESIKEMVQKYMTSKNMLLLGRGYAFANCLEGALKIKELTYMHAEGILAGELKHGPLALIDNTMPVVMVINDDDSVTKSHNALEQVVARGGLPLVICPDTLDIKVQKGTVKLDFLHIPKTVDCLQSVISVIPLQLLAYHLATLKGHDVDCPRNLAKSVTVE